MAAKKINLFELSKNDMSKVGIGELSKIICKYSHQSLFNCDPIQIAFVKVELEYSLKQLLLEPAIPGVRDRDFATLRASVPHIY